MCFQTFCQKSVQLIREEDADALMHPCSFALFIATFCYMLGGVVCLKKMLGGVGKGIAATSYSISIAIWLALQHVPPRPGTGRQCREKGVLIQRCWLVHGSQLTQWMGPSGLLWTRTPATILLQQSTTILASYVGTQSPGMPCVGSAFSKARRHHDR